MLALGPSNARTEIVPVTPVLHGEQNKKQKHGKRQNVIIHINVNTSCFTIFDCLKYLQYPVCYKQKHLVMFILCKCQAFKIQSVLSQQVKMLTRCTWHPLVNII